MRVLDFGRYIAGPYCATLLGEFGADVIRIEKRSGGEDRFVAPVSSDGSGALFLQVARNKRCLTLDPMHREGREIMARLIRTADVVVANLPEPALKAMGLDYDSLCAIRPDIILVTSSAFGPTGPLAKNVGFDAVAQAMSGAVYMTGEPDQPYRAGVAWVDFGTALHGALGAMAALMARAQTGKGQIVTGSLLATAMSFANASIIEQAVIAPNRVATGNRGQTAAPVDIFRTRDGWILLQVIGQPLFERWANLVGEPDWIVDPRFVDDEQRGIHGNIVSERAAKWCAERTLEQAFKELGDAKIPCGPVLSPQQAMEHPQVRVNQMLHELNYPGLPKPALISRAATSLSEHPKVPLQRAPTLGEHTEEILAELGYNQAAIAALRKNGAI